ncbi:hypothetical protein [Streptomyces sp. NBC_01304]|uniref:hypothetical protein n=1 Tax=Streptomyces sp. NBC_01304 TaxID=2903818 RepID=UPI002E1577F8|nr:hypothetical protein OG430_48335 [Streptomyces sp. NBC_01304]
MIASRQLTAARDHAVSQLIRLTDTAAHHSGVPNPVAAARLLVRTIADQNLSGGDVHDALTDGLTYLGFTVPGGWCNECNQALTVDQADADGLCSTCDPDTCTD